MRTLVILGMMALQFAAHSDSESVTAALQRGLLAEEAQRNLTAARDAYAEAVRLGVAEREAIATALYRLAEVQRRLGETNAARTNFVRLVREFPEQTRLVTLARREIPESSINPTSLIGLRTQLQDLTARRVGLEMQAASLEREFSALRQLDAPALARQLAVEHANPLLTQLLADQATARQREAALAPDFGPQHPDRLRAQSVLKIVEQQIAEACGGILATLERRLQSTQDGAKELAKLAATIELQLAQESANDGLSASRDEDPDQLMRQEIALAEQQLKITETRFTSGQASREEVIRAQRDVLALKRQLASQPKRPEWLDVGGSDPTSGNANVPEGDAEEIKELARLRKLAAESPDLLRRAGDEGTPLQRAASRGWTHVITYLLDLGVSPDDATQGEPATALHRAARAGNLGLATFLLERGADVNSRGISGETPLHSAVRAGHRAVAEVLLRQGAQVDAQTTPGGSRFSGWESNVSGNTPLHLAAAYGSPTLVDLLVTRGAKIDVPNSVGASALAVAAEQRRLDCVQRLLAAGANPDLRCRRTENADDKREDTLVGWAVQKGDEKLLRTLLEAGASPRLSVERGYTPLQRAVSSGQLGLVDALLVAGADANARGWSDQTALDLVKDSSGSIAQKLRAAGGTNATTPEPSFVPQPAVRSGGIPIPEPGSDPLGPSASVPVGTRFVSRETPSPIRSRALVYGEVNGVIQLTNGIPRRLGESLLSLRPSGSADLGHISIQRSKANPANLGNESTIRAQPLEFSLLPGVAPTNSDFELMPDDVIYVPVRGRTKPTK